MATQKRRHCSARRDKRRSHLRVHLATLTRCPQCAAVVPSHRVCPTCGSYRGRQVLTIAKKDEPTAR